MPDKARTARQITLFFTTGFAVVTLLLGAGAYRSAASIVREQLDLQIQSEATDLGTIAARGGASALADALRRRDDRGVNSFGYRLLSRNGRRLGGELDTAEDAYGWQNIRFNDQDGEAHRARALTTRLADGARLTIAVELDPAERLRNRLLLLFAVGLALLLAIGLAGGALFGRAIRSRLSAINRIGAAVSNGRLNERIPVSTQHDEFDQLAATLNDMLDRNAGHIVNLRRVSSNVAHELRTPLMRLRLRLEEALAGAAEHSIEATEAERSLSDIDAILALFAALLRIAEVEAGGLSTYFRAVDLSETVEALAESYALVAEDRQRFLAAEVQPGITVSGDRDLLAQIVVNLLENALRHTPAGTQIRLRLHAANDDRSTRAMLVVADNGPGIPKDDRDRALQPFEKLSADGKGHGLGLNLVAAIVSAHNGTMELADNCPGLSVRIVLPGIAHLPYAI